MAFNPLGMNRLAIAIEGVDWWDYVTADTQATVEGAGYFNPFAKFLGVNDKILVQASDNLVWYYVSAWTVPVDDQGVSQTAAAASVTIAKGH